MSYKTLKILLFISLIFNIAFLGNYLYHRFVLFPKHQNAYPPLHHRPYFDKMRNFRREIFEQRREYLKLRREFLKMLQSPNIDEKELQKKLDEILDKEIQMERNLGKNFIKLRKNMSNQEAKIFFENLINRRKRRIRK